FLVAVVVVAVVVLRLDEIDHRVVVLVAGGEAEGIRGLERVLGAEAGDLVAALAVDRARLQVGFAERLEALGLVVRSEADEIVIARAAARVAVDVVALGGAGAGPGRPSAPRSARSCWPGSNRAARSSRKAGC